MLFTSIHYIFFFLPIILIFLRFINKINSQFILSFLVICSLYFYAVWDIKFLFLLIFSIVFNFFIAKNIILSLNKKIYLYVGIIINVSILMYFKYLNFFIDNINLIFTSNFDTIYIIFPLALSFYTIQQIAFLVDCFDGKVKEINFIKYSLFISFFPQLFAGPIVLYEQAYHQYDKSNISRIDYKNLYLGLIIFTIGLSKKVLLADTLSIPVNEGFGMFALEPASTGFADAWVTSLLFTIQIYFDFSGYTDMAIGAALLFNIKLPVNFLSPYKATSIISFWRKWHITLSNFINEYCFNRIVYKYKFIGPISSKVMITLIMTIAGFWHGPSWGYIFFGLIHGLAISINYFWKDTGIKLNKFISWMLTFVVINISFIFFRSTNVNSAFEMIKKMFSFTEAKIFVTKIFHSNNFIFDTYTNISTLTTIVLFSLCVSSFILFYSKSSNFILENYKFKFYHLIFYSLILLLSILRIRGVEFIYFAF